MNSSYIPTPWFFEVLRYAQARWDQGDPEEEKIQEREFLKLGPKGAEKEIRDCLVKLCERNVLEVVSENGKRKCYKYRPSYLFKHHDSLLLISEAWKKIEGLIEKATEKAVEKKLKSIYHINIHEIAKDITYLFPRVVSIVSIFEGERPVYGLRSEDFKIREDGEEVESCNVILAREKEVNTALLMSDNSVSMGTERERKADEVRMNFSTTFNERFGENPIEEFCDGLTGRELLQGYKKAIIKLKEEGIRKQLGVLAIFTDLDDFRPGRRGYNYTETIQAIREIQEKGTQIIIYGIDPANTARENFENIILPSLNLPRGLSYAHREPQNAYNHFCSLTYSYPLKENQYLVIYKTPNQERDGSLRVVCFDIDNKGIGGYATKEYRAPT